MGADFGSGIYMYMYIYIHIYISGKHSTAIVFLRIARETSEKLRFVVRIAMDN